MQIKLRHMIGALLVTLMTVLVGTSVQAASTSEGVGFEITPVQSSSQVDKQVSYFDLKLKTDQTETVAVKVHNTSNEAMTVYVSTSKATTNINGVVEYKKSTANKSVALPADLGQMVTTKSAEVVLKAGETKTVEFQVKMPSKDYNGILAGGITFLKKASATKSTSTMAVNNQYSYTVAMVLHGKQDLTKNKLTLKQIKVNQINGRNVIAFPLANHTAAYLNKVQTKIKIYQRGSSKVAYQQTLKNGQMAPNSIYKLPVRTGEDALKAGKYRAVVNVTSKKQHWQFKQNFEITSSKATTLNKTAVLKQGPNWWLYIGIGLLLLLLILLLIWYIYRKQRKIKELEQQLKEK